MDEETKGDLMKSLKHPYIVQLHFSFAQDNVMYIGMEFAEQGNLFSKLDKLVKAKRMDVVAKWFWEICDALEYLHERKILHRDIKPENILINRTSHALLADFGWSNIMAEVNEKEAASFSQPTPLPRHLLTTFCGTAEYLAPEMVEGSGHDLSLDMWMMGILLYEMIAGFTPFSSGTGDDREILSKIKRGSIWFPAGIDVDAQSLIMALLRPVPEERLRADQAKGHVFISKNYGGRPLPDAAAAEQSAPEGRMSVLRRLDDIREQHQEERHHQLQERQRLADELLQVNLEAEDTVEQMRQYDRKIEAADGKLRELDDFNRKLGGSIREKEEKLAELRKEIARWKAH
eukprot:TRINITY_DN13102_c1_g1_i3.p1 TRINITY_DN13102_c1_g1~~TRINITY_DN13102_c1_g1_i3.p1  ORF type:complete len:346 (-),score=75.15 TRINITY_DN13102_c1_g1_i3:137-1174(-)